MLMVAKAVVIAHEDDNFTEILKATGAIMFFGTPHRGSDIADAVNPMAKLANFWLEVSGASALTGSMRTDLLKVLEDDSSALDDINDAFKQRARDMLIYSFYETERQRGLQQLVSLYILGQVVINPSRL
jgi:ankyrin repeat domain-containing protein 50